MTTQELVSVYTSLHPTNNNRCDGSHCTSPDSKVRIIPLDDSCNVCLCSACYSNELAFNMERELDGLERILPDLPFEVYPIYFGEGK